MEDSWRDDHGPVCRLLLEHITAVIGVCSLRDQPPAKEDANHRGSSLCISAQFTGMNEMKKLWDVLSYSNFCCIAGITNHVLDLVFCGKLISAYLTARNVFLILAGPGGIMYGYTNGWHHDPITSPFFFPNGFAECVSRVSSFGGNSQSPNK